MEKENLITIEKPAATPRTKEVQEIINHLILGITMWLSASITCITTLLTVKQPWCLIVLLLPFIYTMFPQIQKFTTALIETNINKLKNHESKKDKKNTVEAKEEKSA